VDNPNGFIRILIDDVGKFTDVALLVDNPFFLQEVQRLREKYSKYLTYPDDKENEAMAYFESNLVKARVKRAFSDDLEELRKLFKRSIHFKDVIKYAVVLGVVYHDCYHRAFLEEEQLYQGNPDQEDPETKYSIVIHANTELNDIEPVFNEFKSRIKELTYLHSKATDKEKRDFEYGYWFNTTFKLPQDTKEKIKIIRDWYIRRQNGETPLDMAIKVNNTTKEEYRKNKKLRQKNDGLRIYFINIESYTKNVREQIKRYRQLLNAS
jgi:hypothetical protein